MYAFTVTIIGDSREGSVVSPPVAIPGKDSLYVVIMWDDDYTFEVHSVELLRAKTVGNQGSNDNVLQFPTGDGDETAH